MMCFSVARNQFFFLWSLFQLFFELKGKGRERVELEENNSMEIIIVQLNAIPMTSI